MKSGIVIPALFMAVLASSAYAQEAPGPSATRKPTTHPDLSGYWSSATATPLERPASLKDKEFFTPAEATAFEKRGQQPPAGGAGRGGGVGTYNAEWMETNGPVIKTLRTSIIYDPADGHLPPMTPTATAAKKVRAEALKNPRQAQDYGLQDQCLAFPTAVPPMTPYRYNSNYQIVVTADFLMINVEMPHDTRIIPLNNRPHLSSSVRLWLGDSVGHWEGDTIVVDTTNFNDANGFYGDAGGMYGWDRNMHVVERFSLFDKDTLRYQYSAEDPTSFTKPWKGELTMSRESVPVYEYACHEGNYALPNLLKASQ
jgi:hypothetical protein